MTKYKKVTRDTPKKFHGLLFYRKISGDKPHEDKSKSKSWLKESPILKKKEYWTSTGEPGGWEGTR